MFSFPHRENLGDASLESFSKKQTQTIVQINLFVWGRSLFVFPYHFSGSNMGWSNFLAHPPTPGGYLTRRPSENNKWQSIAMVWIQHKNVKEKRPGAHSSVHSQMWFHLCCVFRFLVCFYIATVRILFIDTVAIASLFVYILGCDAPRFVDGCASVGPRVFPVGRVLGGYITYVPSTTNC